MNSHLKLEKLVWDIKTYQKRLMSYDSTSDCDISIKKVIADLELILGGTNL